MQKMNSPRRAGQRPPKMDLVSVKYHIGAPDAAIPQSSTDFRNESNGTSPGTWKRAKKTKTIGLANPIYFSQGVASFIPSTVSIPLGAPVGPGAPHKTWQSIPLSTCCEAWDAFIDGSLPIIQMRTLYNVRLELLKSSICIVINMKYC